MWILSKTYASSLCSQEQAEAFSEDVCLVGKPSALWNATLTPRPSSLRDKTMEASTHSLFGTTSARLTADHGKEKSMSFPEASLAKISLAQEKERASKTDIAPAYGVSSRELFAKYNHATHSWKTPRSLFDEELKSFSAICPKWGMMLRGECWELTTSAHHTNEKESGCSLKVGTPTANMRIRSKAFRSGNRAPTPAELAQQEIGKGKEHFLTPQASDAMRSRFTQESLAKRWIKHPHGNLAEQIAHKTLFPTPRSTGMCGGTGSFQKIQALKASGKATDEEARSMVAGNGGALNPEWVEWLMGWKIGWTDLNVSATDKSHFAPQQQS